MNEQTQTTPSFVTTFSVSEDKYNDPYSQGCLPFIYKKVKMGKTRHKLWNIRRTGESTADKAIGAIYAAEFFQFIATNFEDEDRQTWLFDIFKAIDKYGRLENGELGEVELEFLNSVEKMVARGLKATIKGEVE